MADKKISQMPAVGTLGGADVVPVVQGGVNKRSTALDVARLALPVGGTTGQVLKKTSNTNYAVGWVDDTVGAGEGGFADVWRLIDYNDPSNQTDGTGGVGFNLADLTYPGPLQAGDQLLFKSSGTYYNSNAGPRTFNIGMAVQDLVASASVTLFTDSQISVPAFTGGYWDLEVSVAVSGANGGGTGNIEGIMLGLCTFHPDGSSGSTKKTNVNFSTSLPGLKAVNPLSFQGAMHFLTGAEGNFSVGKCYLNYARPGGGGVPAAGQIIAMARVTTTGSLQAGSILITSSTKTDVGVYLIDVTAAGFSGQPGCVATGQNGFAARICQGLAGSNTAVEVRTYDAAGAAADASFTAIIMGE